MIPSFLISISTAREDEAATSAKLVRTLLCRTLLNLKDSHFATQPLKQHEHQLSPIPPTSAPGSSPHLDTHSSHCASMPAHPQAALSQLLTFASSFYGDSGCDSKWRCCASGVLPGRISLLWARSMGLTGGDQRQVSAIPSSTARSVALPLFVGGATFVESEGDRIFEHGGDSLETVDAASLTVEAGSFAEVGPAYPARFRRGGGVASDRRSNKRAGYRAWRDRNRSSASGVPATAKTPGTALPWSYCSKFCTLVPDFLCAEAGWEW
jgi:hypothetical protein